MRRCLPQTRIHLKGSLSKSFVSDQHERETLSAPFCFSPDLSPSNSLYLLSLSPSLPLPLPLAFQRTSPLPLLIPIHRSHHHHMIVFFYGGDLPGVNGGVICHLRGQKVYDLNATRKVLCESEAEKTFWKLFRWSQGPPIFASFCPMGPLGGYHG